MRKLFTFRSSTSNGGNHLDSPSTKNEKVYQEKPNESNLKSGKQRIGSHDINNTPVLRRSLSFSRSTHQSDSGDNYIDFSRNQGVSPNSSNDLQENVCRVLRCHSDLEKRLRTKHADRISTVANSEEKICSPTSLKSYCNPSVSCTNSPLPLKCRTNYLPPLVNKDLCEEDEHCKENFKIIQDAHVQDQIVLGIENRHIHHTKRPPRMESTAPSNKGMRSYSFRMMNDSHIGSPRSFAKCVAERLADVFPKKSRAKSMDFDSETSTSVQDIFEDFSDRSQNFNVLEHENSGRLHTTSYGDYPVKKVETLIEDTDIELYRKVKEAKEIFALSEEFQLDISSRNSNFTMSSLLEMVSNVNADRRRLALELSVQIQDRLKERASYGEILKRLTMDLNTQRRRLQNEKNDVKLILEKELDRRSKEWSLNLEKFQLEEKRMRDRIRELAEQNVSLQREVASISGREAESQNKIEHSARQVNELSNMVETARSETCKLQKTLLEVQQNNKELEENRDLIRINYKEKEEENKELHKVIARLQRAFSDQQKTIGGLRQTLKDELGKKSLDNIKNMSLEHLGLIGVEQHLRKEVESLMFEVESLRQENIDLLDRLHRVGNNFHLSFFHLERELRARIDCIQDHSLLLLDENYQFCGKLLDTLKRRTQRNHDSISLDQDQNQFTVSLDCYSMFELSVKINGFKKGTENLKKSLQNISSTLQDISNLNTVENGDQIQKVDVELELKAEMLLTRVLKEKVYSKQLELEHLQCELATSIRGHEILRCEVQRAEDAISCLKHKIKDLETQIMKKDEFVHQLQNDLQECSKDLTFRKDLVFKITEERDSIWKDFQQCREQNMLLSCELASMKKKIEELNEEILLKEGQITILGDSIRNNEF